MNRGQAEFTNPLNLPFDLFLLSPLDRGEGLSH
jgi:hypothetical protein